MPFEYGAAFEAPQVGKVYADDLIAAAAFAHFRATGFPYPWIPPFLCMQEINDLAETDQQTLLRTTTAYIVADSYHQHRLQAHAINMRSPVESFNDDVALKKVVDMTLRLSGRIGLNPPLLKLVNGTQACANFRPGFALFMYRKFCPDGGTVLDTSTGYGGRLVGFLASKCGAYIGFDPNTKTHDANTRLAADLAGNKKVILRNLPIEDGDLSEFASQCDFAFTSPPYFCKELYADEPTQSWVRYKTPGEWCRGFLVPMLKYQFAALKTGAKSIVNIADVKIKGKSYPLVEWTKKAGDLAGFEFLGERSFMLSNRMGANEEDVAREPVLVFRKN